MKNTGRRFEIQTFKVGSRKAIVIYEKSLGEAVPFIKEGMRKSSRLLKTDNDIIINVSLTKDNFVRNEMSGVAGFTPNSYTMFINIYPKSGWREVIIGTVAHEFNHTVRFQNISHWKSMTLLKDLAMEGSAQCFEEDATGIVRPWSVALTENQAERIWMKLKDRLDVESKDLHDRVFLKKNDREFPHWAGYTISYLVVKKKLNDLGKTDWNSIIKMKPEALVGEGLS